MAYECFILSRTVKTLYVWAAWVQKAGQAFPFVLWLGPRKKAFPGALGPRSKWEDEAEDASSQWMIWIVFILAFRKEERLPPTGSKETELRRPSLSLEITGAWHLNYHLLPEGSLSKAERSLFLHWQGMQRDEWDYQKGWLKARHSASGSINQVSRGSGGPVCWGPAFARHPVLSSLQLAVSAGPSVVVGQHQATVVSLPVRRDGSSKGRTSVSFLPICR